MGISYLGYAEFHFEVIRVSDGQKITNQRRNKFFRELHAKLGMENPGVFIPPIPPIDQVKDHQIKNSKANSDLVQERRRHLESFLQMCCKSKYLYQSKVLTQFLEE